jgi:SAM-dependent methyltransferase
MHPESYNLIEKKVNQHLDLSTDFKVLDIGSQDVNGSYRKFFTNQNYLGVDMASGNGVDLVLEDPYKLPFEENSYDVILCGQCFEHCEFFWLTFAEMCRVLKKDGKIFLIAPSRGMEHRYPVDCYRFYKDSMDALAHWGVREVGGIRLIESGQEDGEWGDTWGIFTKE